MSQEDNSVEEAFEIVEMEDKLDYTNGFGCGGACVNT